MTTKVPNRGEAFEAIHGGFSPGDTISLYVASTPILLGAGIADGSGFVTVNGTLPADLAPGDHTLALLSSDGVTGFAQALTVSSESTSGGLPTTGSDTSTFVIIGAALLSLGALGVFASRRRTQTTL